MDFSYNKLGQYTAESFYDALTNGTANLAATTSYAYDLANRLTGDSSSVGMSMDHPFESLSYDAAGRITSLMNLSGTSAFTYDNNAQLLTATAGAVPAESQTYDANGNRDATGYATGSDNQMTTAPTASGNHYTYAYDNEGNQTDVYLKNASGGTLTHVAYTWDFRNRLVAEQTYSVSGTASMLTSEAKYAYDAADQRVAKAIDADGNGSYESVESYFYDGANLVLVTTTADAVVDRYLMGPQQNQVLAQESVGTGGGGSNVTLWAFTDHEQTVRATISYDGSGYNQTMYSVFGQVVGTYDQMRMGYTGQVFDAETGLNYYDHREYDSSVGRFISVDPTGFAAGDGNLYRYVKNSPLGATDPTGLDEKGSIDWQKVDEFKIEDLLDAKLANSAQDGDGKKVVVVSDVVGNRPVTMAFNRECAGETPETHSHKFAYRLIALEVGQSMGAEQLGNALQNRRAHGDAFAQAYLGQVEQNQISESLASEVGGLTFALHIVPFGAAADEASQGKYGEAALSAAGDVAMFLTLGGAGVAKIAGAGIEAGQALRLTGIALDAAIGSARLGQGISALSEGKKVEAAGYFGEAFLRLLGVSVGAIQELKAARTADIFPTGARDNGRAITFDLPQNSPVSEDLLRDLNPNGATKNCVFTADSLDQYLRTGIKQPAIDMELGVTEGAPLPSFYNGAATPLRTTEALESFLAKLPDGSTVVITGTRSGAELSAHAFNAVIIDGKALLLDAQNYGVPSLQGYDLGFVAYKTGTAGAHL